MNEATGLETTLQNLMVLDCALRLATCRWCWSRNGVARPSLQLSFQISPTQALTQITSTCLAPSETPEILPHTSKPLAPTLHRLLPNHSLAFRHPLHHSSHLSPPAAPDRTPTPPADLVFLAAVWPEFCARRPRRVRARGRQGFLCPTSLPRSCYAQPTPSRGCHSQSNSFWCLPVQPAWQHLRSSAHAPRPASPGASNGLRSQAPRLVLPATCLCLRDPSPAQQHLQPFLQALASHTCHPKARRFQAPPSNPLRPLSTRATLCVVRAGRQRRSRQSLQSHCHSHHKPSHPAILLRALAGSNEQRFSPALDRAVLRIAPYDFHDPPPNCAHIPSQHAVNPSLSDAPALMKNAGHRATWSAPARPVLRSGLRPGADRSRHGEHRGRRPGI